MRNPKPSSHLEGYVSRMTVRGGSERSDTAIFVEPEPPRHPRGAQALRADHAPTAHHQHRPDGGSERNPAVGPAQAKGRVPLSSQLEALGEDASRRPAGHQIPVQVERGKTGGRGTALVDLCLFADEQGVSRPPPAAGRSCAARTPDHRIWPDSGWSGRALGGERSEPTSRGIAPGPSMM